MAPKLDPSHAIPSEIWFEEIAPDYPVIRIRNQHATATIALHGAHVIDYTPSDQQAIIFTSRDAIYQEGKAIRGGVPVCWPWFNAHPTDPSMPSHGFARNRFWQLTASQSIEQGTQIILELDTNAIELWSHSTKLTLTITVGKSLSIKLTTTNLSEAPLTIGGALHSYLTVGDIKKIQITGLEDTNFTDTITGKQKKQQGAIEFSGETDNVYHNTDTATTIHDPLLKREVTVEKNGSQSTVIWNPWTEKSSTLPDLADDEFPQFVCIEAANAHKDLYELNPGESHSLITIISSRPLSEC
ncbi:D-hexose-6-phosphate mutarotase [Rubritalea spongiae]|uniref:Putative glucose-6-phosphate 1-epimerase n=1 Tax=Rubritalea spongiae TaxID=430797 RepID=A0ABW5E1E0_9BACT